MSSTPSCRWTTTNATAPSATQWPTETANAPGSLVEAKRFLAGNDIPLSGQFSFKDLSAVFIHDLDRNAIELGTYTGNEPGTRITDGPNYYQMQP